MGGAQSHEPLRRRNPFKKRRRSVQSSGSTSESTPGSTRDLTSFDGSPTPSAETTNKFDLSELYGGATVVEAFRYIEGRRYFNPSTVQYLFPSDEIWTNRMMLLQLIFKEAWSNNFSSPVS